ncbi:unnamed protein product [Prunus armeniaca]
MWPDPSIKLIEKLVSSSKGNLVICTWHSPGVEQAQGSARIPKLIHGSFELDACWWLASPNPLFRSPLSVLMDLPLLAATAERVAAAAA